MGQSTMFIIFTYFIHEPVWFQVIVQTPINIYYKFNGNHIITFKDSHTLKGYQMIKKDIYIFTYTYVHIYIYNYIYV